MFTYVDENQRTGPPNDDFLSNTLSAILGYIWSLFNHLHICLASTVLPSH